MTENRKLVKPIVLMRLLLLAAGFCGSGLAKEAVSDPCETGVSGGVIRFNCQNRGKI